jgi:Flp pilus assembly pilin Flp
MAKLREMFTRFVKDEKGLETVEYAVMTALIVAALVTAIGLLTAAVSGRFDTVTGIISGIGG